MGRDTRHRDRTSETPAGGGRARTARNRAPACMFRSPAGAATIPGRPGLGTEERANAMTPEEIEALPYRPCVGLMVANPRGLVFAGQRIDTPGDAWQMPQGGVEEGEDPGAAALRELWEETSIPSEAVSVLAETSDWIPYDLPQDLVGRLWGGRYRGQKQKWFLLRFDGDDSLIDIDSATPEFSRWAWMEPQELLSRIVPFKRDTYARVFAEFSDLLNVG